MLAGCAGDSAEVLEILRNQAPLADCSLSPTGAGTTLREGTFDLAIGDRAAYVLTPEVANTGSEEVVVTGARVRVIGDDGVFVGFNCTDPEGCGEWELEVRGDRVLPPGEPRTFEVAAMPRVATSWYQGQMDADVREGRAPQRFDLTLQVELLGRSDGEQLVGPPFLYPLRLCLGCLVEFPEGTDSPALPGPDCCGPGRPVASCYSGQDDPIDCRACIGTLPEVCNWGRTSCRF